MDTKTNYFKSIALLPQPTDFTLETHAQTVIEICEKEIHQVLSPSRIKMMKRSTLDSEEDYKDCMTRLNSVLRNEVETNKYFIKNVKQLGDFLTHLTRKVVKTISTAKEWLRNLLKICFRQGAQDILDEKMKKDYKDLLASDEKQFKNDLTRFRRTFIDLYFMTNIIEELVKDPQCKPKVIEYSQALLQ